MGRRKLLIDSKAYEALKNTCQIMNVSVESFVEMLGRQCHLPPDESGLISYRQSLNETPASWFHLRQNMRKILNGKSVKFLRDKARSMPSNRPALIICNGPSLTDEKIEMIKHSDFQHRGGVIFCVDSAAKRCLNGGLYPTFVVHVDNHIYAKEFYKGVMTSELNKRLCYIVPTDMHPEVLEDIRGEIFWYNIAVPDFPNMNKNAYLQFMFPELPLMDTGGNVGTFAIILANYPKCNPVGMIGFDLSWREEVRPEETENFYLDVIDSGGHPIFDDNGLVVDINWPCGTANCPNDLVFTGDCDFPKTGKKEDLLCRDELYNQYVTVKDQFGNNRLIEKIYDLYIQILEQRMLMLHKQFPEYEVYNCSEEGLAYVKFMKQCPLMEFFETETTRPREVVHKDNIGDDEIYG